MTDLDLLTDSIAWSLRETEPFLHVRMRHCFAPHFYSEMLANLPDVSHYRDLEHRDAKKPDGTSTRKQFTFKDRELAGLPDGQRELWTVVRETLTSQSVETWMRRVLDIDPELKIKPRLSLIRDLPGYHISIHPDVPSKVITSQFYLAREGSRHEGSNFYRRGPNGFERVTVMPFTPNTGYAFAVTPSSWHGVNLVTPEQGERDSLMLIYYREETPI